MPKTIVISLGGSIIVPQQVDVEFLRQFRALVLRYISKGYKFVIVCGGGGTNRIYNTAAQAITQIKDNDLDWIGIAAINLNAELMRAIFAEHAYGKVINNPNTKLKTSKPIVLASGWKPGCSSDHDAVLWAKNLKAKEIVNLSNVDYVYDKDPKVPGAKPLTSIRWKDYQKIAGTTWSPRMSVPFDPIASKFATKLGIKVMFAKGTDIKNLENILEGKTFKGTTIGPN